MPTLILVDENDTPLGEMEKLEAHKKGLLHRAFSIMLYRFNGDTLELLLQKRNIKKYHCGGIWANTCCSHPEPGESTLGAANRRLQEEVNINVPLKPIGHFIYKAHFDNGLTEHELDHVFVGEYLGQMPDFNLDEIEQMRWENAAQLKAMITQNGEIYAPWLEGVLDKVMEELSDGRYSREI